MFFMLLSRGDGVYGGPVISLLDCQSRGFGDRISTRAEILIEISAPPAPQLSYDKYAVSEKMRRRGRGVATRPHNAEAKKMKSLTLHTHGPWAMVPKELA